jgi:hypothetical protein
MKLFQFLILIFFVKSFSFSQQYDGVYIEKLKIDKNNKIYKKERQFIFDYKIIVEQDTLQLDRNSRDTFSFLPYGCDSIENKEIEMTVVKKISFRRTNRNQSEIKYVWNSLSRRFEIFTSVVENEINTWIHPIRYGFFRSLETCPFPYFKTGLQLGDKWNDSMLIGQHWGNPFWATWDRNILMKYEYKYLGKKVIQYNQKDLNCHIIKSKSNSEIGESYLTTYYSEEFGFVKMNYVLTNGVQVLIELKEMNNGANMR